MSNPTFSLASSLKLNRNRNTYKLMFFFVSPSPRYTNNAQVIVIYLTLKRIAPNKSISEV